jgi:hypothetical protein
MEPHVAAPRQGHANMGLTCAALTHKAAIPAFPGCCYPRLPRLLRPGAVVTHAAAARGSPDLWDVPVRVWPAVRGSRPVGCWNAAAGPLAIGWSIGSGAVHVVDPVAPGPWARLEDQAAVGESLLASVCPLQTRLGAWSGLQRSGRAEDLAASPRRSGHGGVPCAPGVLSTLSARLGTCQCALCALEHSMHSMCPAVNRALSLSLDEPEGAPWRVRSRASRAEDGMHVGDARPTDVAHCCAISVDLCMQQRSQLGFTGCMHSRGAAEAATAHADAHVWHVWCECRCMLDRERSGRMPYMHV